MSWVVPRAWAVSEDATAAKMNEISAALLDLDRRTSPAGAQVATPQTTTSTSYSDLATIGPAVTVTIGGTFKALVTTRAALANANVPVASYMGVAISAPASLAASDPYAIGFTSNAAGQGIRCGMTVLYVVLPSGVTTFTAKYRTDGGGTLTAVDRGISVTPLGS